MGNNEVVMFLLGICALSAVLASRHSLKRLPSSALLISSFYVSSVAWAATILEDSFWPAGLNSIEHIAYAIASVLLLVWAWRVVWRRSETS